MGRSNEHAVPTVDRCVCMRVTLEQMREYADRTGCGLAGVQAQFQCGTACGMCLPYIRRMLRTGETRIPLLPQHRVRMLR